MGQRHGRGDDAEGHAVPPADVLRRDVAHAAPPLRLLSVSGVQLNLDGFQLRAGSARVELNVTEFGLLRELMDHAGMALTRAHLTSAVWGDANVRDRTLLETYIRRVRGRLRQVGADDRLIRTVRGIGFVFESNDASNYDGAETPPSGADGS
jgi:DNA-binding response OmpR family regulator